MRLETERLIIRYFEENDDNDLYEYMSKEEVVKYEPYEAFTYEQAKEEAKRRITDHNFFAVALKSGKVIGNLYFAKGEFDTWEIGYVFNNSYWGQGYATEAVKALLAKAFGEWNVRRVIAMCNPENESSWKLMERVGMRKEGHLKKNVFFFKDENGEPIWQDTYEYGLLKEEIES